MASSTVTIDTNEWLYPDKFGVTHAVTNGQTFTLTVTDGGASNVTYSIPAAQKVTTTDGYTINLRQRVSGGDGTNVTRNTLSTFTDAGQGSNFYGISGEIDIECPVSGDIQHWKPAKVNPSDADYGSAGTIAFTLEDQFGNVTSVTGVTVGQAA